MNKHTILPAIAIGLALVAPPARAEFYVAPFVGMALIDSTVTVGGVKLVDQGGDEVIGGARAGWGTRLERGLYLGVEAQGFLATGRSRAVVNGDAYSWAVQGGAGVAARAGWAPAGGGSLFFVRGGVLALVTGGGTEFMPEVGIGAEVGIKGPWFLRIDLGYAWNDREFYTGTIGVGFRF